jgi:hypothetical protein
LHRDAAKWQLYELAEREATIKEIDVSDRGNIRTRLVQCPDDSTARARFADPISLVRGLMPEADIAVLSSAEIAFRRYGLELARAQLAHQPASFRSTTEIVSGLGAADIPRDLATISCGACTRSGGSSHSTAP